MNRVHFLPFIAYALPEYRNYGFKGLAHAYSRYPR